MKHAKLVAWGLIISVGSLFLAGMFEIEVSEGFTELMGIAMCAFATWAVVILLKNAPNENR